MRIFRILLFLSAFMFSIHLATAQYSSELPSNSAYVTIGDDGHLYLNNERVRFWGAIGKVPAKSYEENEIMVKRIKELGFNLFRYGITVEDYTKGDGSKSDLFDHFLFCCKKEGIYVWFTGLNKIPKPHPDKEGKVAGIAVNEAWVEANNQLKNDKVMSWAWDKTTRKYRIDQKVKTLNHVNQYTGFRYADDPVFAVFELSNEEWWFHRMKRGQFLKLPQYFLDDLYAQWNEYLIQKYGSQSALKQTWIGNLLPGESLDNKSVLMLPLLEDFRDDQASTLGVATEAGSVENAFSMDNFNGKRGADVIEFLLKVWIDYKQAEADAVKATGKAAKLIPLVWDTGIGFDLPTQYMQQHADAISHDSYWNGAFHTDPNHKRFPWVSQLEELPKVGWDDPWLEHNRMEGKPFLVYETQLLQPAKYRAEYPMEIVKLASIQDWDIINWHYWGHPVPVDQEQPYAQKLDYPKKSHYTQGYHYQFDEVQQSVMTTAGEIFKNFLLKPAPNPTKITIGKNSLYDWNMNSYGQLGKSFVPTVYRYGMRLEIDPTIENDRIEGPIIKNRGVYEACPIEPTGEISHDWQKGHLIFDAPGVNMYTGFFAQYGKNITFKNGLTLRDVTVVNPEKMPYPVTENEKYIAFSVVSTDGKEIGSTNEAYISLVSTSFNSGFTIDEKAHASRPYTPTREWMWNLDYMEEGDAPVLVARVGGKIESDLLNGMKYEMLDWHFNTIKEGTIKQGALIIPANLPVFIVRLTR